MTGQPTPAVLRAVASELDYAADLCAQLEALVSRLVAQSTGEPLQTALREAQTLDVLTQQLGALADFSRELSASQDLARALGVVPLSDLATRLAARLGQGAAPDESAAKAGEFTLF